MGNPGAGRKSKPVAILDPGKAHYGAKAIAARREAELKLKSSDRLVCPSYLSDEAKKVWKRIMKIYRTAQEVVVCDLDQQLLIMYCDAVAIYKMAQEKLYKIGEVSSQDKSVQVEIKNCLSTMGTQCKTIERLAGPLALSPDGRAKLSIKKSKKEEPTELEKLLNIGDE